MEYHPGPLAAAVGSVLLPIEWQARGRVEESRLAVEAWLEAILALSAPVSTTFVLCAGGEEARGRVGCRRARW